MSLRVGGPVAPIQDVELLRREKAIAVAHARVAELKRLRFPADDPLVVDAGTQLRQAQDDLAYHIARQRKDAEAKARFESDVVGDQKIASAIQVLVRELETCTSTGRFDGLRELLLQFESNQRGR